jgi:hypothetical protein
LIFHSKYNNDFFLQILYSFQRGKFFKKYKGLV